MLNDPMANMAMSYGQNLADQGKDYVEQNVSIIQLIISYCWIFKSAHKSGRLRNSNTQQTQNICIALAFSRRWSHIVQMLFKCFVFTGVSRQF